MAICRSRPSPGRCRDCASRPPLWSPRCRPRARCWRCATGWRTPAAEPRSGTLFVAARPFQVNPPGQFLNLAGRRRPASATIACDGWRVWRSTSAVVLAAPAAQLCGAAAFDEGPVTAWLLRGDVPRATEVGRRLRPRLGGARLALPARRRESRARSCSRWRSIPVRGRRAEALAARATPRASRPSRRRPPPRGASVLRPRRDRRCPTSAAPLVRTLRTGLAAILIHRDGAALQPGSRAYARSWIRDGALTGSGAAAARRMRTRRATFAAWYAGFLYPDGKVPCCVDRRGADPVPENDSHGEWIHLVAEITRYTGDLGVRAAAVPDHRARGRRTSMRCAPAAGPTAYRSRRPSLFFGLLPESISHEGYSEKPMHSYWDDAFALPRLRRCGGARRHGLGAPIWRRAGRRAAIEFRADLLASLAQARERHGIDYLPGSAELGDFDATSTTVLLEPGGLGGALPRGGGRGDLRALLPRVRRAARRRAGVGRLHARTSCAASAPSCGSDGASARTSCSISSSPDRRPAAWNQWAEVVFREPRTPRFLGDLPHGWVASDFARSFLDLFAYERREDGALVLGAGLPRAWFESGEAVGVRAACARPGESSALRVAAADGRPMSTRSRVDGSSWPPGGVSLDTAAGTGRGARSRIDGVRLRQRAGRGRFAPTGCRRWSSRGGRPW